MNMTKVIKSAGFKRSLRNQAKDLYEKLQVDVSNYSVANGGCHGFITNPENGNCVYINTDSPGSFGWRVMFRVANDNRDFDGYKNNFVENEAKELAKAVIEVLTMDKAKLARKYAFGRISGKDTYKEYRA